MEKVRYVAYTKNDKEIVRSGIVAIQEVLMGTDADRKRSLLFCLDWFMDPYYGQDISDIHDELVELLQTVIICPNEEDVIEDALQLLTDYEWPPFKILENNLDNIPKNIKPDVLYAINMDKSEELLSEINPKI